MSIVGIGVNLVKISDMRTRLKQNPRFAEHLFTSAEAEMCEVYYDPAERYSGRFAAKRAFHKALPSWVQTKTDWLDVEITIDSNGRPGVLPSKKCKRLLGQIGVNEVFLSISHESGLAIAFIILCN